jgi:large subunit ribosomal protein L2
MGKRIIPQARGAGGPRYRAPSHRYLGKVEYLPVGSNVARIVDIVHDVGRSAPVMIVRTEKGKEILHIAPEGVCAGDFIHYEGDQIKAGNVVEISKVPVGTKISGIETFPGSGPKMCRASGTFAFVYGSTGNKIIIQFPRGSERIVDPRCRVMIGVVAAGGRQEKPWVKAGKKLHAMMARGKLFPRTLGVAMGPVNHPYGGAQKSSKFKCISRDTSPGRKIGSIAARRTGFKRMRKARM